MTEPPQPLRDTRVVLAAPRGFCAGVDRAIAIADTVIERENRKAPESRHPLYIKHELVHNVRVVADLTSRGVRFVEDVQEVPDGSVLVFSAHGVANTVRDAAERRDLEVIDATCPLVTKVHHEVKRYIDAGFEVCLIGHRGHPEVEGTLGQVPKEMRHKMYLVETKDDAIALEITGSQLACVTQTTLSVDDVSEMVTVLKARFPQLRTARKQDICYATQNRQDAVRQLALESDRVIVVGSQTSSNSRRLQELAERCGVPAVLIDNPEDLDMTWLKGARVIGMTAGASAPESQVQDIVQQLCDWGAVAGDELKVIDEDVHFRMPAHLEASRR